MLYSKLSSPGLADSAVRKVSKPIRLQRDVRCGGGGGGGNGGGGAETMDNPNKKPVSVHASCFKIDSNLTSCTWVGTGMMI